MIITELLAPIEERLAKATPKLAFGVVRDKYLYYRSYPKVTAPAMSFENSQLTCEMLANASADLTKLIAALKRADKALEQIRRYADNEEVEMEMKQARTDIVAILGGDE